MNLLQFKEIIFFNRVLQDYFSKRNEITISQKQAFSLGIHILYYCLKNSYQTLSVHGFLSNLSNFYMKQNLSPFLDSQMFLFVIKILVYCSLSLSFKFNSYSSFSNLEQEENLSDVYLRQELIRKNKKFLKFLFECKQILLFEVPLNSNNLNKSKNSLKIDFSGKKAKPLKVYYTYRLTFQQFDQGIKQYYMGYRGCSTIPKFDNYYSSSKLVKNWLKKNDFNSVTKKILGLYLTEYEALSKEVRYHSKLKVDTNKAFLNQARQTSTAFLYDNTGRIQTSESNRKRSEALKGKNRFTEQGLTALKTYQTQIRKRSNSEIESLRKAAIERNSRKVICPYCNKEGQLPAMRRWHFENCKFAPNNKNNNL